MKIIIAFTLVAVLACVNGVPDDIQKIVDKFIESCIKETGISPEVAKKLSVGDRNANDKNAQCFAKCFFERTGVLDKNGVPQRDVFLSHLIIHDPSAKKEVLEALADRCTKEKGVDSCETAFKIYQCYWTK